MTVTFFSSVLNHHQISLCNALRAHPDICFTFVQMIELTDERRAQGFTAMEENFVVNAGQEPEKAYRLCMESDVVIAGVIDQKWVNQRVAQGKLTFAYKERFCKDLKVTLRPGFWKNGYCNYFRFRNKKLYLLCASAYTASDTKYIFPRKEKKFKWGYFPALTIHPDRQAHLAEKEPMTILWVGRFLALKHPEVCIYLAQQLKKAGYRFRIDIIGLGEMKNTLETLIQENNVEDCVKLLGQKSPEQVRQHMGKSQIFLLTSNHKEGWGAVLNEAMSEGCACISSKQAGSTGFLIRDGENGFSYDCNDLDMLVCRVAQLLNDKEMLRSVQTEAMKTIAHAWNAQTAADRFVAFCRAMQNEEDLPVFESGPMSRA